MFFIAFLLLGSIVAAQFRSIMYQNKQKSAETLYAEELKKMLDEEKANIETLKAAVAENEKTMNQNLKSAVELADDPSKKSDLAKLDDIQLKAGLKDVKGQGIIIKLDDAVYKKNYPVDLLVIHQSDVEKILNELKVAGAQAISINDERLLATSETICAGPTILINHNKYPVPYVIKAIGNSDNLYKKVNESNIIMLMRRDGIRITIDKSKEVQISKYMGKIESQTQGLEVADQ
jgi:uncharacterized protein YlxW (UPF0749 family)